MMHVICKNANLNSDDKLVALLSDLSIIAWDIILFSDSRRPSQDIILDGNHRFIYHLGAYRASGVGILIHSKHVDYVKNIVLISDREISVDFINDKSKYRYIALYMPHSNLSH